MNRNMNLMARSPQYAGGSLVPLLLLGVLIMASGCEFLLNRMAFHPDRTFKTEVPPGIEEVRLSTADGLSLLGLYAPQPGAQRIVVYLHGNAGNVYHRIPELLRLRDMGVAVLGVSYRGYSDSQGSPSEAGISLDGRAGVAYCTSVLGFAESDVVLLGRSIGSAAAVDTAVDSGVGGVILVTPMTSARALAARMGLGFLAPLAGNALDNLSKIGRIGCPLLIVHGDADEIVPFSMGRELYEAAEPPKRFVAVPRAGHNTLSLAFSQTYSDAVQEFLRSLAADEGAR